MGIVSFGSRPAPAFEIFLQLKAYFMAIRSIDFKRLEVYEAGALLVTLLAYPGESEHEEERRSRVHTRFAPCALGQFTRWIRTEGVFAATDKNRSTRSKLNATVALGLRTLPRRLPSHDVPPAWPTPVSQRSGERRAPKLPLKRLSLNAMAGVVLEDAGHSDPGTSRPDLAPEPA
jgi:hypothetical protein